MGSLVATITGAAGVFVGTNIDDLVVLTALFLAARTHGCPGLWQIIGGQYAGFLTLVVISLGAAAGLVVVPDRWIGVLGLIPLVLGVRGLQKARSHNGEAAPIASSQVGIAFLTIGNGADNISIYTPVFRTLEMGATLLTLGVFLALLAIWCIAGFLLSSHTTVIDALSNVGHVLVPIVFIVIGCWILIESTVFGVVF